MARKSKGLFATKKKTKAEKIKYIKSLKAAVAVGQKKQAAIDKGNKKLAAQRKNSVNSVKRAIAKGQTFYKGTYTPNEKVILQHATRLQPAQTRKILQSTKAGKTNLAVKTARMSEKAAKENPFLKNVLSASNKNLISSNDQIEQWTGKKVDTKKADESLPGKIGYAAGVLTDFATTGGPAATTGKKLTTEATKKIIKDIATKKGKELTKEELKAAARKAVLKAAIKKKAKSGAKISVVSGAPTNVSIAAKESDNPKDFLINLGVNAAIDAAAGGGFSAATKNAIKAKTVKKPKVSTVNTPQKNPSEAQIELPKTTKTPKKTPKAALSKEQKKTTNKKVITKPTNKETGEVLQPTRTSTETAEVIREAPHNENIIADKIKNAVENRKTGKPKPEKPIETNPEIIKEFKKAANKSGTYKGGTPKAIKGERVSQTVDTIKRSNNTPEEVKTVLNEKTILGEYGIKPKNQEALYKRAEKRVTENVTETESKVKSAADAGGTGSDETIADAIALYNKHVKDKSYDKAAEVAEHIVKIGTKSGRALQAHKLILRTTPEGRMRIADRNLVKLSEQFVDRIDGPLKLSDETRELVANAKTENEIFRAMEKANIEMWDQIPATFLEKMNAFRYLSMLGNPKTHMRNILGNIIFKGVRAPKNVIQAGMESTAQKAGLIKEGERTTAVKISKENKEFAKKLYDENEAYIRGKGHKFFDNVPGRRPLDSKVWTSPGFGKAMERASKVNSKALEFEDVYFSKKEFQNAFSRWLESNKYNPKELTKEQLDKGIEIARQKSLEATYRNDNRFADWLNTQRAVLPQSSKGKKIAAVAVEGTAPFVKTPANILTQAIKYSPVWLVKGTVQLMTAAGKKNTSEVIKAIESIASGLTGTGIVGFGLWLQQKGILSGAMGDTTADKYKRDLSEQPYAIQIGDYSLTVDWAVPAAMPLLVGAEIGKAVDEGGIGIDTVLDKLSNIVTPMTELSMLQGLNNTIEAARTVKSGSGIVNVAMQPYMNYGSQFIPTAVGQLARTIDGTQRTTTSTAESPMTRGLERWLNKNKNKIPWLSKTSQPYVDKWGNEVNDSSIGMRILENFFSPAYIKKDAITATDKEVLRLFDKLDEEVQNDVIPKSTSSYDIKYKDETLRLKEKELTAFQKDRGKYSYNEISALVKTDKYQKMSNSKKAEAISRIYDEARTEAKIKMLVGRGNKAWDVKTDCYEIGETMQEAGKAYVKAGGKEDNFFAAVKTVRKATREADSTSSGIKAYALAKSGADKKLYSVFEVDRYIDVGKALVKYDIGPEKITALKNKSDADGNDYKSKAEVMALLESTGYSTAEKSALFRVMCSSWNAKNPYGDVAYYNRTASSGGSSSYSRGSSGGSSGRSGGTRKSGLTEADKKFRDYIRSARAKAGRAPENTLTVAERKAIIKAILKRSGKI